MTLLSPLLIWGTLLGAIPIIIHLLNRRRFRRVEWAPMHYLRLTIQRNRRKIQLEELLLLLLRIALPSAKSHCVACNGAPMAGAKPCLPLGTVARTTRSATTPGPDIDRTVTLWPTAFGTRVWSCIATCV